MAEFSFRGSRKCLFIELSSTMRLTAIFGLSLLSLLVSGAHSINRDVPFIKEFTVGGRPYVRYSTDNLILTKPETVTLGQTVEVTCEIDPELYGSIRTCSLQNPNGDTLLVDSVTDQILNLDNGQPVSGLAPSNLGRPDAVCGVVIESVSEADLGKSHGLSVSSTSFSLFRICSFVRGLGLRNGAHRKRRSLVLEGSIQSAH